MKKFIVILTLMVFLLSVVAFAAEQNQNFIIGKDEVKDKVIFGAGQAVSNLGTVNNDFFAAGQVVSNDGVVAGDLFIAGQTVTVSGPVGGNIRAACQTIDVKGEVGRNALVLGQTISLTKDSVVNGNATIAGSDVKVLGTINKGLNVAAASVMIDGTIVGDVSIQAESINILPTAKIDGNLSYTSSKLASIPAGVVAGTTSPNIVPITQPQPKKTNPFSAGNILWMILWLISTFILGALLIKLFTPYFSKSSETIKSSWAKYAGIGFLTLVVVPVSFFILLITILGAPVAIISLVIYAVLIYLSKLPVAIFIGHLLIKEKSIYLKLFIGLAILTVIYLIPILGGFTKFIVLLIGLGTLVYNLFFVGCCEPKAVLK